MKKPKVNYAIQAVTNALRVLDAYRGQDEYGVTELARQLGLHKNNVFRLLATLQQWGYVEQTPAERYRLGLRSFELGQAFLRARPLARQARPVLEELVRRAGESAHLSLLRAFEVVALDSVTPQRLIETRSRAGSRLPVHCTASGKVLLGCAPEDVREKFDRTVVGAKGLEPNTSRTIVDPHKFFEQLRTVAGAGFATDFEECEAGLVCAAVPIYDATGQVVASLSVSGPSFRVPESRVMGELVPLLVELGEGLSRDLGYAAQP